MKKTTNDILKMFGEVQAEVSMPSGRELHVILPELDLQHGKHAEEHQGEDWQEERQVEEVEGAQAAVCEERQVERQVEEVEGAQAAVCEERQVEDKDSVMWIRFTGAVPKRGIRFEETAVQEQTDRQTRIAYLTNQLARELTHQLTLERERAAIHGSEVHEKLQRAEETNTRLVISITKKREKIIEQSLMIKRLQAALTAYKNEEKDQEKDEEDAVPRGGPFDP